jgi:hypothetical protein
MVSVTLLPSSFPATGQAWAQSGAGCTPRLSEVPLPSPKPGTSDPLWPGPPCSLLFLLLHAHLFVSPFILFWGSGGGSQFVTCATSGGGGGDFGCKLGPFYGRPSLQPAFSCMRALFLLPSWVGLG